MNLKFFLALALLMLFCGCSLLAQDDEEALFATGASRCDVASPLSKK
ncbi:MAG: hypothetical protein HXK63_10140 [Campylobacter sp.]|nr:hypothetical protein [Campylobacter sp.]